jgi:antitoxin (DNA-binding transcriptional repressor) of toxin-antitoxin stability system
VSSGRMKAHSMTRLVQRSSFLLVTMAAALVALAGASPTRSAAILPTIYVNYTMDCTFSIVDDTGKAVTAVAPGQYQVDVRTPLPFGTIPKNFSDMTACRGMAQFQLTGPGVNVSTTLTAGCESDEAYPVTLQPGATYVAQDLNQPSVARGSFSTLASGTAAKVTSPYTNTTSGKGTASSDIVGSAVRPQGTLVAVLSSGGKLTLTKGGKPVVRLVPGRYTFAITDKDTRTGFGLLGPKTKTPRHLTAAGFVGRKSATVTLTTGRWTFLSGLGQIHFFTVAR